MTCKPPNGAPEKSLHLLANRHSPEKPPGVWMWVNNGWSKPDNQRYGTRPSGMATLGWRYIGPADTEAGQ